jgi:DNA repair exonuclease SbcCD nuclease subunit
MTRKPIAVLTADVHYNLNTLEVADKAMRMAIAKANELKVPFIVAGDLHDTKANLRGECVKAMLETFRLCEMAPYILVGNHDKINEKGLDHSLEFLDDTAHLVKFPVYVRQIDAHLVPYQSEVSTLEGILNEIPKGSLLIMHQGVQSANMGHYVQDKTSLPKEALRDFRVISGHYHCRQDIKCGPPRRGATGLFSYIGNPYSLSFGEAKDPPKGFQVLYDDGLMEFVPTNLRKHVVEELDLDALQLYIDTCARPKPGDLLWLKVKGPKSELSKLNKREIGQRLLGHSNFKLDLIAIDSEVVEHKAQELTGEQVFDNIIDSLGETQEEKQYLKALWREIL